MHMPRQEVIDDPIPISLFEQNKDGSVSDFLFHFHEVTSLHPPSFQRNDKTLYGKAL